MTVKERLIIFIKSQNLSQRAFEIAIEVSNGYVNNIRQSIQPDKLQRIALCYPTLNISWLLYGEGEMIKGEATSSSIKLEFPPEFLDKFSKLIDTVCSQQETIASQQRMIERHSLLDRRADAREVGNAGSADVG